MNTMYAYTLCMVITSESFAVSFVALCHTSMEWNIFLNLSCFSNSINKTWPNTQCVSLVRNYFYKLASYMHL